MALPVAAGGGLPDAVLDALADAPDGLSDAELCARLREAYPGLRPQRVNHVCRQLAGTGVLERVGSRPIRNRSLMPDAAPAPDPAPEDPAPGNDPPADDPPSEGDPGSGGAPGSGAGPDEDDLPPAVAGVPVHDPAQGWSRPVNVAAAVADWLVRRGATIRAASADGAAHDLVVALDGDDVHVEVTGWPTDGVRTHPTTVAGEWFSAAAGAAGIRRRAHPRARVVIALPETRRYRALATDRSAALADAGTEIWFVDPRGAVRPL